jgi:hypothetical protein
VIAKIKPRGFVESSKPQSIEINSAALEEELSSTQLWPETNSKWLIIGAVLSFWLLLFLMSVPCLYYAIKERNMTLVHPGHPGAHLAQKTVVTCGVIVGLQVALMLLLMSGTGDIILVLLS